MNITFPAILTGLFLLVRGGLLVSISSSSHPVMEASALRIAEESGGSIAAQIMQAMPNTPLVSTGRVSIDPYAVAQARRTFVEHAYCKTESHGGSVHVQGHSFAAYSSMPPQVNNIGHSERSERWNVFVGGGQTPRCPGGWTMEIQMNLPINPNAGLSIIEVTHFAYMGAPQPEHPAP